MTNRTKSEFTSRCRIAAKTNFLMMLLFSARSAHARYSSRMIDRFLNWGDHGKPKSGKIKGRCQPPLVSSNSVCNHTRDSTNRTPATRSSDFVNHSYDYRPNWAPLSPVTITNSVFTVINSPSIYKSCFVICLKLPPPRLVYKLFAGGKVT